MPKTYTMNRTDPTSFPRPNMTMREVVDFARDHSDQIALENIIVTGPHEGTELRLTKVNYAKHRARYNLNHYTWSGMVNDFVGRIEKGFAEGRIDPDKVFCPVEA